MDGSGPVPASPAPPSVLARVAGHYDHFPYPDARFLVAPCSPEAGWRTLEWDVGWTAPARFSRELSIWVAGCGTVQATEVARRYPAARLLATDLSPVTLEQARRIADAAGVGDRIDFRQHDLSTPLGDAGPFDLIDCVGVLHHLPEPARGLETLAAALTPGGVIDLMVYQEGHRRLYLAFRQALALLAPLAAEEPAAARLDLARRLARDLAGAARCPAWIRTELGRLAELAGERPAWFADTLIHPHEHVYTPLSLLAEAEAAGLAFAGFTFPALWDPRLYLQDPALRQRLDALDLPARAEVLSLLLADGAPFLELYLAPRAAAPPAPPGPQLLRQGRVLPHGPWQRTELGPGGEAGPTSTFGPEPQADGSLKVPGPRGASLLPPAAATVLSLVGEGCPVAELLTRAAPLAADRPEAEREPWLLGLVSLLCSPQARLLLFAAAEG